MGYLAAILVPIAIYVVLRTVCQKELNAEEDFFLGVFIEKCSELGLCFGEVDLSGKRTKFPRSLLFMSSSSALIDMSLQGKINHLECTFFRSIPTGRFGDIYSGRLICLVDTGKPNSFSKSVIIGEKLGERYISLIRPFFWDCSRKFAGKKVFSNLKSYDRSRIIDHDMMFAAPSNLYFDWVEFNSNYIVVVFSEGDENSKCPEILEAVSQLTLSVNAKLNRT